MLKINYYKRLYEKGDNGDYLEEKNYEDDYLQEVNSDNIGDMLEVGNSGRFSSCRKIVIVVGREIGWDWRRDMGSRVIG